MQTKCYAEKGMQMAEIHIVQNSYSRYNCDYFFCLNIEGANAIIQWKDTSKVFGYRLFWQMVSYIESSLKKQLILVM